MAKGDVSLKFDAQTGEYVQKMLALRQAHEATAKSARELGDITSAMGDKVTKSLQGITSSTAGVVMGMVGVGSAVSLVANSFNAGLDRMREKSDKLRESLTSVEEVLYKLNRLEQLPEIRSRLAAMAEGVTNREGAEGIFNAAANHLGTRATEEQLEASVKASMGVIRGGGTHEQAAGFAGIFGDFRSMTGAMAKVSDADLAEASAAVQAVRGEGLSEKELKYIAKSKDPLKAIDFILAAAKSHENPRAVESLANAAEKEITPAEIKSAKGAEKARLRRLSEIPTAERLTAMLADPTLAAAEQRGDIDLINRNLAPDVENAITARPFAGRAQKFQQLVQDDPQVKAQFALRQAQLGIDTSKEKGETTAITDEAIWKEEERLIREGKIGKGFIGQYMPASAVSAADRAWYALTAGGYGKEAAPGTIDPIVDKYNQAKASLEAGLREHAEALNRNTAATEQNTRQNSNPTHRDPNNVGQQ